MKEKASKSSQKSSKTKQNTTKKSFSIYALASGKPGKKFTIKQFLEITKNAKKKPGGSNTSRTIKLNDGYIYEADSQQEISTLKKLMSHDSFKRLRGQCISIPYRYAGKDHNYYPDFIMLTHTNKIVIMEVKEVAQMCTKQNIKKYEALKRYCARNGYLYIMCDKAFIPYERLEDYEYHSPVVDAAIEKALNEKGKFDYNDYKLLIEGKDHKRVKKIRKSIGVYIASHKKVVKEVGDLYFKVETFQIRYKKKK